MKGGARMTRAAFLIVIVSVPLFLLVSFHFR